MPARFRWPATSGVARPRRPAARDPRAAKRNRAARRRMIEHAQASPPEQTGGPRIRLRARGSAEQMVAQTPPINKDHAREKIKERARSARRTGGVPTPPGDLRDGRAEIADADQLPGVGPRRDHGEKVPEVQRGVLTVLKTSASRASIPAQQRPSRAGALGRQPRQSAHRAGDGQSRLGASVRSGNCRHGRQFGMLGNEPEHPELLDALAVEFVEARLVDQKADSLDYVQPDLSIE